MKSVSRLLLTVLSAASAHVCAADLVFSDIAPNAYSSAAYSINNAGEIGGAWNGEAAIWSKGQGTIVANSGDVYAINDKGQYAGRANIYYPLSSVSNLGYQEMGMAKGINNLGQVVGRTSNNTTGATLATLWSGGVKTTLDFGTNAGRGDGEAWDINDNGTIVGTLGLGVSHAVTWNSSGKLSYLAPTNVISTARAVNNAGQIVGAVSDNATLWVNGAATTLSSLGGVGSMAHNINNQGQIVGMAHVAGSTMGHAVLWNGGTVLDLNQYIVPAAAEQGWVLESALGINDSGDIVGLMRKTGTYVYHGFLLSSNGGVIVAPPVPEPETYAMMLAGLVLMWGAARRRARA